MGGGGAPGVVRCGECAAILAEAETDRRNHRQAAHGVSRWAHPRAVEHGGVMLDAVGWVEAGRPFGCLSHSVWLSAGLERFFYPVSRGPLKEGTVSQRGEARRSSRPG